MWLKDMLNTGLTRYYSNENNCPTPVKRWDSIDFYFVSIDKR